MALAERGVVLAEAQWRLVRLDIAQEVQRAYIDVQIAEQMVWVAEDRVKLEKEIRSEAIRRVRGYKDPLFVETRADARILEAELALKEVQAKRQSARALLASFWGGTPDSLVIAEGIEKPDPRDPPLAEADAAVFDAAVDRARAQVVVEQSRAHQDYTVSGGTRFLRETNDVAVLGGISIPLGRFDRNQGNIARAQAERRQLEFQSEASRLERLRRLATLRADADAAHRRWAEAVERSKGWATL